MTSPKVRVDALTPDITLSDYDKNLNYKSEEQHEDNSVPKLSTELFGNQEDLWIFDWEISQNLQVRATLLSVGTYCYIYMQNSSIAKLGEDQAIKRCTIVKDEFDSTI
ncbi:MAG: hypothetical protein ACXAAM_08170, partial [Candidatus Heimdallarchaeaceae archaeon]